MPDKGWRRAGSTPQVERRMLADAEPGASGGRTAVLSQHALSDGQRQAFERPNPAAGYANLSAEEPRFMSLRYHREDRGKRVIGSVLI
jgi:hypothetical protein